MRKTVSITIMFFLLLPLTYSQEAEIELKHYGFGETPKEVNFRIRSLGEMAITNVDIYVDGKEYKELNLRLEPGRGIYTTLILEPGEHLVEVRTPEGAHDSEAVSVSSIENVVHIPPEEQVYSFTKTSGFKILLGLLLVSLVIVWILVEKPKLDLS
ncbi:MAG: hypothetical protein GF368_02265 [Candidatus Aenigmarchaeota archaeon]|nr:hypothetical protein [Candidatus Aenigmarchaeota archaeon]